MEDYHGHTHTFVYCTNGRLSWELAGIPILYLYSPTDKKTGSDNLDSHFLSQLFLRILGIINLKYVLLVKCHSGERRQI